MDVSQNARIGYMSGAKKPAPFCEGLHIFSTSAQINCPRGSGKYGKRGFRPFAGAVYAHASGLLGKRPN